LAATGAAPGSGRGGRPRHDGGGHPSAVTSPACPPRYAVPSVRHGGRRATCGPPAGPGRSTARRSPRCARAAARSGP